MKSNCSIKTIRGENMEIGKIISDAIRYPSSNLSKVVILGVLFIASILIVPIFLAIGYLFRIIKANFVGIDELPKYDKLGDMFLDGLKVFVVSLVYAIPLLIISYIISVIMGNIAFTIGQFTGFNIFSIVIAYITNYLSIFASHPGLTAAYIVYMIVSIIISLIAYIAIANMAFYDGNLCAAFKFNEIFERISQIGLGKYIIWYIVMLLLALVTGVIAGLTFIIIIGFVLVPLVIAPYFAILAARSLSLLFASSEENLMKTQKDQKNP